MKKIFLFMLCCFAPVCAQADTLLLGPTNLRMSESGEFSWVDNTPAPQEFDNFWAYNPGLTQKGKVWLNTIIAEKKRPESFTQNEKVMFVAACMEVKIRRIPAP